VKSIPSVDDTYPMHTPHDDAQDTPAAIYTSVTAVNNRAGPPIRNIYVSNESWEAEGPSESLTNIGE